MNKLLCLALALLLAQFTFSQDQILLQKGETLIGEIIAINDSIIDIQVAQNNTFVTHYTFIDEIEFIKHDGLTYYRGGVPPGDINSLKLKFTKAPQPVPLIQDLWYTNEIDHKFNTFIITQENKLITENVEFSQGFFTKGRVNVKGEKFPLRKINFIKSNTKVYARDQNTISFAPSFFERIETGKVNLFRRIQNTPSYTPGVYFNYTYVLDYYNKGYTPLRKANYKNLKKDLADDPESLFELQAYRKTQKAEIIAYIGSGLLSIAGLAMMVDNANRNASSQGDYEVSTPGIVISSIGSAGFFVAYYLGFKKHDHIDNAIQIYNRPVKPVKF